MKKYRLSEQLGNIDEAFLEEVFEYTESRSGRKTIMKSSFVLKSAAIAACAAIAIGIGAVAVSNRGEMPVMPEAETAEPAQTEKAEGAGDDIVVVEKSYNERIADGETVTLETYIGKRIEH